MWQLTGSGDGPYEIQEDGKRIAIITHTDLETACKMAAAERLLKALEWLLHLNNGVSAAGDGRPVSILATFSNIGRPGTCWDSGSQLVNLARPMQNKLLEGD